MRSYALVSTPWGTCGLVAMGDRLVASYLPDPDWCACRSAILRDFPNLTRDDQTLPELRDSLRGYFVGGSPVFRVRLVLDGMTAFQCDIVRACRKIRFGETLSYGELARRANHSGAARAVGGVMARNRFPLIVPCHRVVASGGRIGGFSGPGGVPQKESLLAWEQDGARCIL